MVIIKVMLILTNSDFKESKKSTIFKLNKEPNIAISRLFELRQKTNNIYSVDISSITDLINNDLFVPSIKLYYDLFKKLLYKCYMKI